VGPDADGAEHSSDANGPTSGASDGIGAARVAVGGTVVKFPDDGPQVN
jgi:hypothetical protein